MIRIGGGRALLAFGKHLHKDEDERWHRQDEKPFIIYMMYVARKKTRGVEETIRPQS